MLKVLKVKDIMDRGVVTILPSAGVKEICKLLIKNKLSGVPVVDKSKKLVGFISERDIIDAISREGFLKRKVKDIMNKKAVSVRENMLTEEVAKIFTDYPFRYLPVTRGEKVIGSVTRREVIENLLGQYY